MLHKNITKHIKSSNKKWSFSSSFVLHIEGGYNTTGSISTHGSSHLSVRLAVIVIIPRAFSAAKRSTGMKAPGGGTERPRCQREFFCMLRTAKGDLAETGVEREGERERDLYRLTR